MRRSRTPRPLPLRAILAVAFAFAALGRAGAEPGGKPAVVRVVKVGDGFELQRDGKPFFIKGGGGDGSFKVLAEAGGNSVRTWGPEKAAKVLDEAQKLGLTVTLGIWLGHERHGFNYNDADQVAKQSDAARSTILRFKDHPALLLWGIGNEMEGNGKADNAAIYSAINNIANLAKALDPNHPTMTVLAGIGGEKINNVHRLCPDVDIVGINSYGGAASVPKGYKAAGGTKPYVLTEFGPAGQWEVAKTSWGAAPEATSTEKAAAYRETYKKAVAGQPLCLGSYAFTWGVKQEATATWFGLFLADGSRTSGIDALTELWSGKPPANRCPTVEPIKLSGPDQLDPSATVKASIATTDPEKDPLKVKWVLQQEGAYGAGGDAEAVPPTFPEAILKADDSQVELRMPKGGGGYRLYATVHDGRGNAATANVPLFVKGPATAPNSRAAKLPLVVYDEAVGKAKPPYAPSGYMGNTKAIKITEDCPDNPHAGKTCLRVDFLAKDGWGGVAWQDPANDWGDAPGGFDLAGAKRLTFWARGDKGGEAVSFSLGLLGRDKKYFDTATAKLEKVTLTPEWQRFTIDLAGKDLSRIKTGFAWTLAAEGRPVTFFLDDIRYE